MSRQLRRAPVEQVRVGPPRRAAHATAQLVELGQAQRVGAVDDDGVGVGDVEARLDDRRAHQHVVLAAREGEHHPLQAALAPSGRGRRRCARAGRSWRSCSACASIVSTRLWTKNTWPPRSSSRRIASRTRPARRLGDARLDRQPVLRRRLDDAHVAHPGERQVERPRDGRGRQRQHVDLGPQLLEALLVGDAEALLLVDHDQAQVAEARCPWTAADGCR